MLTNGKCPLCLSDVRLSHTTEGVDFWACLSFKCPSKDPFITFPTDDLDFGPDPDDYTPELPDCATVEYREGLQSKTGIIYESHDGGTITICGSTLKNEPDVLISVSAVTRLIPWAEYLEAI